MLLTKQQAMQTDYYTEYPCGEWAYKDNNNFWHLFINNKEVTANMRVVYCEMHGIDYWSCKDEGGRVRLFKAYREYKEILVDKHILNVSIRHKHGLIYCDNAGNWHKVTLDDAQY